MSGLERLQPRLPQQDGNLGPRIGLGPLGLHLLKGLPAGHRPEPLGIKIVCSPPQQFQRIPNPGPPLVDSQFRWGIKEVQKQSWRVQGNELCNALLK